MDGKKKWYFADGEIPPMGSDPDIYGHESLIVLNPNEEDAELTVTVYWTDRDPMSSAPIPVKARRVRGLRATELCDFLGGTTVKAGEQYALLVESTVPVIIQYGRLEVRQPNMAFYACTGLAL